MARPKNQFPVPFLRFKDGCWRICWRENSKPYEFSTGERDESAAESTRLQVALALRGAADWPEWAENIPAIQRWRKLDAVAGEQNTPDSAAALEAWRNHYAASISRAEQVQNRYKEVSALATKYDLLTLTPEQANEFVRSLAARRPPKYYSDQVVAVMGDRTMSRPEIIKAMEAASIPVDRQRLATAMVNRNVFELIAEPGHHRTGKYRVRRDARKLAPRTRNEYLLSCNMFYKWALEQGLVKTNPFAGIKRAARGAKKQIIYCTREERAEVLEAAAGEDVELAVNIAFYAGLRKGEIIKLRWEHIDIARRWIRIYESKTKKPRNVPISSVLLEKLTESARQSGYVVPGWHTPKKTPEVVADSYLLPLKKKLPHLLKKLRWNVFRHTFGSLLAQGGRHSIDQICALMGNTPEVCREHYAEFIPDAAERTGIDAID